MYPKKLIPLYAVTVVQCQAKNHGGHMLVGLESLKFFENRGLYLPENKLHGVLCSGNALLCKPVRAMN